ARAAPARAGGGRRPRARGVARARDPRVGAPRRARPRRADLRGRRRGGRPRRARLARRGRAPGGLGAAPRRHERGAPDPGRALPAAQGEEFVPNDAVLPEAGARILVLTGPNMSGKSTYLRQVAQIALLAQIGSSVPAESARLGVVDRVFTRVGASDRQSRGES